MQVHEPAQDMQDMGLLVPDAGESAQEVLLRTAWLVSATM